MSDLIMPMRIDYNLIMPMRIDYKGLSSTCFLCCFYRIKLHLLFQEIHVL